jgi:hypothetical protein
MNTKMLRGLLIGAGLLATIGLVAAQVPAVPQVSVTHQNDLIQVIPNGAPSAQSVYGTIPQITNAPGYYKSIPVTGFTYQWAQGVTYANFAPAGTIAAGYVTLASNPSDGSRNCIFSTNTITAIYVCKTSTGVGNCVQTGVNNAITTLSANTSACYTYSTSNSTWDRS